MFVLGISVLLKDRRIVTVLAQQMPAQCNGACPELGRRESLCSRD